MSNEFDFLQFDNDLGYESIDNFDIYQNDDRDSIVLSDSDSSSQDSSYNFGEEGWDEIESSDELQYLNTDDNSYSDDEHKSKRKKRHSLFSRKTKDKGDALNNRSEYQHIDEKDWDIIRKNNENIRDNQSPEHKSEVKEEPEYGPNLSFGPDITIDEEAIYNATRASIAQHENKSNADYAISSDMGIVAVGHPDVATANIVKANSERKPEEESVNPNLRQDSSAFVDADVVVERAEFENIDINREEARGTIPYSELRDMCIQFAKINESGVSVHDTIRILMEQTENDNLRDALESVHDQIKSGEDLSTAMSNCTCFPFAFTIAVSAAEKNDMVALAFKRFGDIFDKEEERKETEKLSFFYPALITACSLAVMVVMMLVVYPNFVNMFSELGSELPQLSKALLAVATYFGRVWWIMSIVLILILLGIVCYKKLSKADLLGPKLGEKSVPAGSYKRMNVYAKFARYMNALFEVGVATKDALFVTAHSFTEYPFLTARLLDAANAAAAGSTLSNALCVFEFFPIMILQMISVGEEMGDTPKMLMYIAEYYEEESRRDLAKRAAKREPISIIIMAVIVLFLLLSMLQPVLRFYELVNQM